MNQTLHEKFAPVLAWLDAGAPHQPIGPLNEVGFNMSWTIYDAPWEGI